MKAAPLGEMQACAAACALMLQRGGYCDDPRKPPLSAAPALSPEQVILQIVNEKLNAEGEKQARQVFATLLWLEWDVLPTLDGRNVQRRANLAAAGAKPNMPDPEVAAELLYGEVEHLLAESVRQILGRQSRLAPQFREVVRRAAARSESAAQPDTQVLPVLYRTWLAASEAILTYVAPTSPLGLKVPHGAAEWNAARRTLEAHFKAAGFKNKEILLLLPHGGSMKALKARTRRARRRGEGATLRRGATVA